MPPLKAAIHGPKARLIIGRRPIFLRARLRRRRKRRIITGQSPVQVAAKGGDFWAEGPKDARRR